MIILLLLLPTLVLSTEPLIDWTTCKNETNCLCMTDKGDFELNDLEGYCTNGGIQNKYFTENSALIQVQLTGENARNFGDEPKLMILPKYMNVSTPGEYFGCKRNKTTEKVELTGDSQLISTYRITLFEDRSRFDTRNVICALKIERAHEFVKFLKRMNYHNGEIITHFSAEKRYKMVSYSGHFLNIFAKTRSQFSGNIHSVKCNPYSFKDLSYSDHYHVKPIVNRDRDVLNCENYETNDVSYTMRYDHSKKKGIEMKELKCAQDPSGSFLYSIVRETDEIDDATGRNKTIEEQISSYNDYTFYCAADLAESCVNPVADCNSINENCPLFNAEKVIGSPATLECPENKWLIDGEYYQLEANPVCKRKKNSKENGGKFYAKLPCGREMGLSGARCYTQYDCMTKSKLDLPICNNETLCGVVDTTDKNVLKCKADNRKLRIYSVENDKTLTESSYQCNPDTGLWYNGDIVVREGSVVGCDLDKTHPDSHSIVKKSSVADKVLPDLLNAIRTLLNTLTGDSKVPGESPNESRLKYGATEVTHESALAGEKQP